MTFSRLPVLLLIATIGAAMFAGDVDLGPFSARVYLYGALTAWMVVRCLVAAEPIVSDSRAIALLCVYGAFLCWVFTAALIQDASRAAVTMAVTYHGFSIITALLTFFIVRDRVDVSILLAGLTGLFLLSCGVALLQWQDLPAAWGIWYRLRPHVGGSLETPGEIMTVYGWAKIPIAGLYGSSVAFGYAVAIMAPIVFRRFAARPSVRMLVGVGLTFGGVLVVQQRSALLAAIFSGLVLLTLHLRPGRRLKTIAALAGVLLAAAILIRIAFPQTGAEDLRINRYQVSLFADAGRLQVAQIAVQYVIEEPLAGGVAGYVRAYEAAMGDDTKYEEVVAPHNFFLNAAVFYGLPGLFLAIVLFAALMYVLVDAWRSARRREDWTTVTLVLAVFGYLINAMFHNASFVTGDFLPWVLIGALLTSSRVAPAAAPVRTRVARVPLLRPRSADAL
jgi:O-antigen ligase